jgi:PadR family transcriptional regulator PadR
MMSYCLTPNPFHPSLGQAPSSGRVCASRTKKNQNTKFINYLTLIGVCKLKVVIMNDIEKIHAKLEKDLKTGFLSLVILQIIDKSTEPIYGYRIIKSIEDLSNGRMNIIEGTLYILLKSLQNQNLVKSYWGPSTSGGPPRKYYEITKVGKKILKFVMTEWDNLNHIHEQVNKKLG